MAFLAGFGLTPAALAVAPLATEAKVPLVVMAAGTSIITERSPYIVRTSFTLAQSSTIIADWAAKNGIKKVVTHGVGLRARRRRREVVQGAVHQGRRRQVVEAIRFPLRQSRFRAVPAARQPTPSPTRCSCSCRPARARTFMKQFVERGLDKAGIKLIGPGDVTDDDMLNGMGDVVIGTVTAHFYSAAHPSADEQGLCRGVQEGEQRLAAELHGGRRL